MFCYGTSLAFFLAVLKGGLRQMAREAAFEDGYGVVMVKRCSLME